MDDPLKLLVVEDDATTARLYERAVAKDPVYRFDATIAGTLTEALDACETTNIDVILLDLQLPDARELAGLRQLTTAAPDAAIIILTGLDDTELALQALQEGAQDYLTKDKADYSAVVRAARYAYERKQLENRLFHSEERYRWLCGAAFEAIVIHEDDKILDANDVAAEQFGLPHEELIGMSPRALSSPASRAEFGTKMDSGSDEAFEVECMRTNGSTFVAEVKRKIIEYRGRDVHVTAFRDITLRKRIENELKWYKDELEWIINSMGDGLVVLDERNLIVRVNRQYCKMRQSGADDMIGTPFRDQFDEASIEAIDKVLTNLEDGEATTYEAGFRRHDGTVFDGLTTAQPIFSDGVYKGLVACITDVTVQKQEAQERLEMEQKMQHKQKLQSLGMLAGGIAHDFNNLLTGILGNASIAVRIAGEDSLVLEAIRNIETIARRASDLTSQLLAYAGKGRIEVRDVDLSALIEETMPMLQVSVYKKIAIVINAEEKLPRIKADVTQMRQVLMNLVINASDSIGDRDGTITVTTHTQNIDREFLDNTDLGDVLPEGDYVAIDVEDTGCGMDDKTVAKIFEPFFSTKSSGHGLGLATVLGIVRRHKGALKVSTALGEGTVFSAYFPCSELLGESRIDLPDTTTDWRGRGKLLVIDDEDNVRHVADRMLALMGFTVITAADGIKGLELFRANAGEIVAVLLDRTMPHMSGDEVFELIRESDKDVPVVFASGYNDETQATKGERAGPTEYIHKPFGYQDLNKVLKKVLS